MKILIVDDERLAREELHGLLEDIPGLEVCGEAADATQARQMIQTDKPDLVLLDVQMPGGTGFDLLATLPPPHPPFIFVTAYDTFALRAFEVSAIDYLMKPVHPQRLAHAIDKVRTQFSLANHPSAPGAAVPDTSLCLKEDDHVYVRDGDRSWFVPVRALRLLEAKGNYTKLYFENDSALIFRTLGAMETRLPTSLFIRANRSQLVNLSCLENVQPWFSNSLKAKMRGGPEIEFSRRQAQLFRERMSL